MFEGLRRWLHEVSQDTFSSSLAKHTHKTSMSWQGMKSSIKSNLHCMALNWQSSAAYAGPVNAATTTSVASWKAIERQLQELPFAWFDASDQGNAENHSSNTLQASSSPADDHRVVALLSPAPQTFADFSLFMGSQGKRATPQTSPPQKSRRPT